MAAREYITGASGKGEGPGCLACHGLSRAEISGWLGGRLKIKVSAPPEVGKANLVVEKFIAKTLGLPAGSASIVGGKKSSLKFLEVRGLSADNVLRKLSAFNA